MIRLSLSLILIAPTLILAPAAQAERPRAVDLAQRGYDFAFDPEAGAVAAIDPAGATVHLYSRSFLDGKTPRPIGPVSVGPRPLGVTFKRTAKGAWFLVLCHGDQTLYALDARTLAVAFKVRLTGSGPSSVLASTHPDDPFVYYCYGRGHDSSLGRVDLHARSEQAIGRLGSDSVMDAAISARGDWLYTRGPWSPSGFNSYRIGSDARGTFSYRSVVDEHRGSPPYVAGPFNQFTASGKDIWSADLKTKAATLPQPPIGFATHRPLIFAVEAGALILYSYNTFKPVGRVQLPVSLPASDRWGRPGGKVLKLTGGGSGDFKTFRYRSRVFSDAQRDRLLACYTDQIGVVPLKPLGLPDEPLLNAEVRGPTTLEVGQAAVLSLAIADARVKATLSTAPKGMTHDGTRLSWTPASDHVGPTRAVVRLSDGRIHRDMTIAFDVRLPFIALPQVARRLIVDATGTRALVVGGAGRDHERKTTPLVLVDLTRRQIVAQRELSYRVRALHLDGHAAYVAPQEGNLFRSLSLTDLSDVKRMFVNDEVEGFADLPGGRLLVMDGIYDPATLKKVGSMSRVQRLNDRSNGQPRIARPLVDGLFVAGRVLTDGPVARLIQWPPPGLRTTTNPRSQTAEPQLWNRMLGHGQLNDAEGKTVASWRDGASMLLRQLPLAATVRVAEAEGTRALTLELRELLEGTPRRVQRLRVFSNREHDSASPQIAEAPGRVVVAHRQDLFLVDLKRAQLGSLAEPLSFRNQVQPLALASDGTLTIKLAARGGSSGHTFELQHEQPGLTLDAASGALTVDGRALWAQARTQLCQYSDLLSVGPDPAAQQGQAAVKELLGQAPAGFPVAVPLLVSVVDSSGQRARLSASLVLTGPVADLRRLIAERKRAQHGTPAEPQPQPQPPAATGSDASAQRLDALAERLATLTGRVEAAGKQAGEQTRRLAALEKRLTALESAPAPATGVDPLAIGAIVLAAIAAGLALRPRRS